MAKERLCVTVPSIPSQDLSELCHLDISYNHLRLVPKMGPSGAALGTLILRGNELQSLHGEWGSVLGVLVGVVVQHGREWGRYETQGGLGSMAYQSLLRPSARYGVPRLAFLPCLPPARPLHSTPPHPTPLHPCSPTALLTPPLSSLPQAWNSCGTCGTWMWPTTCWRDTGSWRHCGC